MRVCTPKRGSKLPWREAGPPSHYDDEVDSDHQVVNKELSLYQERDETVQLPGRDPIPEIYYSGTSSVSVNELHSFILTLILVHEITDKEARQRSNLLRFLKSRFQLELNSYMTSWISLPFVYTTPRIILLAMYTYKVS